MTEPLRVRTKPAAAPETHDNLFGHAILARAALVLPSGSMPVAQGYSGGLIPRSRARGLDL